MKVFKFGGASVKDADGVRNLARIVQAHEQDELIIIVSAMGKTTNAMEEVHRAWRQGEDWKTVLDGIRVAHVDAMKEVASFEEGEELRLSPPAELLLSFGKLVEWLSANNPGDFDQDYDYIVGHGELWSTMIVSSHLSSVGLDNTWLDAREVVCTNNRFRSARVNWQKSQAAFDEIKPTVQRIVSQGFIGRTEDGSSTTLGREGSDFSAAIFAYLGNAESVTIWKDVDGMYNADPRKFDKTTLLEKISYREAIELSYFGASVIHPRTVKPLQNKSIPLYVRSFIDLDKTGSLIGPASEDDALVPSFISKPGVILLTITPKDLSFIMEEHMAEIFGNCAKLRMRIELTQNSALAFSAVVNDLNKLEELKHALGEGYELKFNDGLDLLTVRHYTDDVINELIKGRKVLLEQRSRSTARFVLK